MSSRDTSPNGVRSPSAETARAACTQKPCRRGLLATEPGAGLLARKRHLCRVVNHEHRAERLAPRAGRHEVRLDHRLQ